MTVMTKTVAAAGNKPFSIPVPEPDLTADEMVARARALRPLLRSEQRATELRCAPSPEAHRAIRDAGLYRVIQPRRFGGYEFSLVDMCRIAFEIARGCPSTGWYYSFSAGHTSILAQCFSEQAQIELFGPDGDFLAPGRAPMGTAKRVEGGWEISGKWDYCSGSAYSTHFIASVVEAVEAGEPRIGAAILQRSQYAILDDWGDTLGLRGTASNTIVVDKQFVPDHWVGWHNQMDIDLSVPQPGWEIHMTPLYAARFQSQLLTEIGSWAVGTSLAMLDEYEELLSHEGQAPLPGAMPGYDRADRERIFGVAYGMVHTAKAAVLQTARAHAEYARRGVEGGEPFSKVEDMGLKLQLQRAMETSWDAVEMMFRTSGSAGLPNQSRIQRYYRDFALGKTHFFLQLENHAAEFAKTFFEGK